MEMVFDRLKLAFERNNNFDKKKFPSDHIFIQI